MPRRASALHLDVVRLKPEAAAIDRRTLFERLRAENIGVNVHYIPVHMQPYYRSLGFEPGDFPVAEDYYSQALSLPLFPSMTAAEQHRVVQALTEALT